MSYQRLLFLATVCAIGAFLTLVLRIAHPHHRQLAVVCSQLVCKAYETIAGVQLEPRMSSGRLLLSPNEIAIKYDREMDAESAEFEFVLFLDGTEVGNVVRRGAEEFRASWSRPKWHIVFQDS